MLPSVTLRRLLTMPSEQYQSEYPEIYLPYNHVGTVGELRELLKNVPDDANWCLEGGDDWATGHSIIIIHHKENL